MNISSMSSAHPPVISQPPQQPKQTQQVAAPIDNDGDHDGSTSKSADASSNTVSGRLDISA